MGQGRGQTGSHGDPGASLLHSLPHTVFLETQLACLGKLFSVPT